jgi:hypothetical protein
LGGPRTPLGYAYGLTSLIFFRAKMTQCNKHLSAFQIESDDDESVSPNDSILSTQKKDDGLELAIVQQTSVTADPGEVIIDAREIPDSIPSKMKSTKEKRSENVPKNHLDLTGDSRGNNMRRNWL